MKNVTKDEYESMTGAELAAWRNENEQPYIAANGHEMIAYPQYAGGRPIYSSAWTSCTDDCGACAEGDPLPDWWADGPGHRPTGPLADRFADHRRYPDVASRAQ